MAAPTIYRSDDTSAPTINGTTSALRVALNAILVNGYGSKTAAGWTKAYEDAGNHLVAYKNAGLGRYLRVDDSQTRVIDVRGYRTMSAISTGTDIFPSPSATAGKFRKSVTADSTARPWICLANERHFFLIVFGNQTTIGSFDGGDSHLAFGELESQLLGDKFTTFIDSATDTSTTSTIAGLGRQVLNANANSSPSLYAEGSPAQSIAPLSTLIPYSIVPFSETISGGTALPAYPDPSTGKLLIARMTARMGYPSGTSPVVRGYFPGLWMLCHPTSGLTSLDTFSGSGSLASRTFLIVKTGAGGVVFETTAGSWDF